MFGHKSSDHLAIWSTINRKDARHISSIRQVTTFCSKVMPASGETVKGIIYKDKKNHT